MKSSFVLTYSRDSKLMFGDRPEPSPGSNDVLIAVKAASVNPRDWLIREGRYPFQMILPKPPLILGSDAAGVIAAVGGKVTGFRVGDEVYASQTMMGGMGAYAEYMKVHASSVALKPRNMSFEEAASVPLAALTSWRALFTNGRMKSGQHILIIGGSGSCGMFGVQIAKAFGVRVTAVCSTDNVAMVKELGADQVIDYRKQRFQNVQQRFDLIYDTIGKESPGSCRCVLRSGGRYVTTVPSIRTIWDSVRTLVWPGRKARVVLVRSNGRILSKITGLIEEKKICAVIDRVYPLEQAEKALTYSRTFHTKGKLVLKTDECF